MDNRVVSGRTLLQAVRAGDLERVRAELPQFLLAREGEIRAIARRKLTRATRAVYDSEDVLSTVLRRLDAFVAAGRFDPASEAELWGLVVVVTRNAAVSKVRLVSRLNQLLGEDGEYGRMLLHRANACRDDEEAGLLVTQISMWLPDAAARQLLNLRLRGATHAATADVLGISTEATRQRWKAIKDQLLDRMRKEGWQCP